MRDTTFDPDVATDDNELLRKVERLLARSPRHRRLTKVILAGQAELRRVLDDTQWAVYMALEQAVNERIVQDDLLLVRWAFDQGRKPITRPR